MPVKTATALLLLLILTLVGGCKRAQPADQAATPAPPQSAAANRALSEAQRQARRHPADPAAQLTVARLSLKYGNDNDAYRAYRRVVELEPGNYEALVGLAQVNLRLQNPTEGLDWLLRAKRLKPHDVELTELEARLLLINGNFDRSLAAFEQAIRMAPKRASTRLNLASAYALMNRPKDAVAAAREAVRLDPTAPACHFALARHLQRAGDNAGAEQAYRQALRHDAQNAPALIGLARLLMDRKQRLEEARQLAIRASQIRTDRAEPAIIAAWILHLQGNDQGAANELIKLVNANPQNPEAWQKLAVCLRRIGKSKEARDAEDMARRFVPESASAADLKAIQGR